MIFDKSEFRLRLSQKDVIKMFRERFRSIGAFRELRDHPCIEEFKISFEAGYYQGLADAEEIYGNQTNSN